MCSLKLFAQLSEAPNSIFRKVANIVQTQLEKQRVQHQKRSLLRMISESFCTLHKVIQPPAHPQEIVEQSCYEQSVQLAPQFPIAKA